MTPSPVLDRVDNQVPRSQFFTMHRQHHHPYSADIHIQPRHGRHPNGNRMHSQQFNLDEEDGGFEDNRSTISEQSSSMVPSATSPRSDVPAFSTYRRVSAPLPSIGPDTATIQHGHPPSAIQHSPSPPRSGLHFQPRPHGRFFPQGPDEAFGRPKSAIHNYPFPDAKMSRAHNECAGLPNTGGSPPRGDDDQSGATAYRGAPPSASFSYVISSGLGPRRMMEEHQHPLHTTVDMVSHEATTVSSKEVVPPSSPTPLTLWRDPLSAPPASNMAVSELAPVPSPEPFSRGGKRLVGVTNDIVGGAADGAQVRQSDKGQEGGREEHQQEEDGEGTFTQGDKRRAVANTAVVGALKPGTETGHPIGRSGVEAPHDARTPSSHVPHQEPFATPSTTATAVVKTESAMTTPPHPTTTATTSWHEDGAWVGREPQRQLQHQKLAQEQEQEQEFKHEQQQQRQMQMQMHTWPTWDRDADRERMGQQQSPARNPEHDSRRKAQQHYHHSYNQQSYVNDYRYSDSASNGDQRNSRTMDDKDVPTRLTHVHATAAASPPSPASGTQQASYHYPYQHQHQHQGSTTALDPTSTRPVAAPSPAPRSYPPYWESSVYHQFPDATSCPSEMAHPSMPSPAMSHPGRSMPGMTPTTPSSMSMSSPHSASSNRLHATGLGFVPPNENSIRSRYSISEGIQPLPPPPTHSTLNDLSSKGGVPYQSHPPPYNQQSQQVAIDANATHRPPHPFYIQHTPQGHPGEQPQQPQHIALPQQQQHPQQTYPPHHAPPPQRHHPYHTQDVSSNSPFQSTLLPHSSGNKRRSVADLLFVPVKSKERRSGSVSGAIGLESTSSPWTPTTVAGTPNASTLRQPSNFSRSSLSISSPTRGGPAPAPSGTPATASAVAIAMTTSKGGKNRSAPTTPRSGKGSSGPKTFQCTGYPGCNMVFTRSEHLARHERKHTGEKPFKCIVANCTRTFSRYDNMIQHTQTHSDRSKREVDVHRTGAAHSAHGIGNAGRGGSYGRGSSILHKSYVPSSVPSGNLSTPSVLATEHPSNVPNQWSNYGSPAIHGNHSPGPPPPGPRTSHSRSLSSVRSAADPNNEAFGIDPRLQEEHLRMGEATAPVQPGPGVSHLSSRSTQQSPHTPRHGSQSSSGFSTFEIQRPDTMGNRSPEGLMSGAAVMAHRCVSGSSSGSSGAIGLGVVPLTPSSVHTQPLPYVERLTPYEHEMLMEHRRSLANTPDLASSGSPSPWAPAHRGSIGSGKGGSHGNSSHEQIHHPTDEEKRRLTDHRWSTPDIASLPSPKPSTVDSTERIATQPPPARDAKPGTQWYTSGSTLQMNQASTPRMVEEVRPVSQESLGHPPFPPQPQPQPQTQQRAHSIPLPHPLAVSRLSGSPIVGQGSGSVRPVSIPSISSSSASQSASEARTSISLGSVLPPILSPHTSDPRAFSMHPPSPGVHHQHSPHLSSGRLPPTQPKSGIHPLSRSNSFSQPSPHAPSGRTSGEADESSLPSTSSMELDNLQGHASPDKHMWKRTKKSEVSEHDRLRQSLSRPSNAGISSNSAGRQYKEEYLSSAVAEMLTQDFAPVTLKSVESRLRRMDEKQYQQLRTVVSEKYAHHLKVHPLFLNNLTALLCVVEDENLVAQGKDVDNQDSAMEIDSATTLSSGASLAFERIDPDSYGHQQSTNTHTKGLQGLTITPHEEIPDFVAIVTDNMNQSPSGDTRFVLSRLHLPPHAYCLREHLNKNFTLSRNPTEWGLYRFQEYPSLRFLILKSVMLEYSKTKESLKTGKNPIEDETHGSGKDGSMAVDDPTPRSTKPKWRMALTLVESVEDNEQVPREMLDTIMQFDWTLSGHVRRAPFSEQPLMGVSRSTKVWTHLDRLALHPTELEVLGRDYEMLPPPSSMRNDESNIKEEEVEIVAARFVHTDSLAPVLMAFLWADMYREYEENGCLYDQEGDLTEDMGGHAYEERKDNEASVGNDEAGLGVQDYQGEEQRYPDVDDGSDQASMPDSFKRWRTSRRSTADSSSPSASRRGSVIPSLLTMSTITSTATQVEGTAAGSTTTTTEEQRLREKEPLVATATSTGDNNSQTSAARHANLMSTASTSVGRRISIAELCSPMQTLGNTTSYTSSNNSNAEYRK